MLDVGTVILQILFPVCRYFICNYRYSNSCLYIFMKLSEWHKCSGPAQVCGTYWQVHDCFPGVPPLWWPVLGLESSIEWSWDWQGSAWSTPKCDLHLDVCGQKSRWFVRFVALAVVTPHLSFSSSVVCLLPKWHSNSVKPQRGYLRVLQLLS